MAVNTSRDMRAELEQGLRDGTYMQLQPDWSLQSAPPTDRLTWPTYRQVIQHSEASRYVIEPLTPRESAGLLTERRASGYLPRRSALDLA